jgi:polyisoprenoid-binding protein YceI
MRQKFYLPVVALALTVSSACALAFSPPSTKPDAAPSGTYSMDASHTSVLFSVSHLGFSHYFGRFNTAEGTLEYDAANPENSKIDVKITVASIDTNNEVLEKKLVSDSWFDAEKFPTATFTSTKVEKLTESTGKVTGDLTLHGVTKPVTLEVTFNGGGVNPFINAPQLGFSARGLIKRSEFGITEYVPMVGDDAALTLETELVKK